MTKHLIRRPPVLLLHGLGGTGETLHPLARALERRGFAVAHPTLAEAARRDIRSWTRLAHLGLDDLLDEARAHVRRIAARRGPPIVCGHSNGALLALALGAEDIASGVVLMAPVPPPSVGSGVPLWLQNLFFRLSFGASWQSGVLDFAAARRLDPDPPSPETARTLLPDSGRVLANAAALKPGCWFDPMPLLDVPCAVLAGDLDRILPLESARRIAERYGAAFHLFPGVGHWFPSEKRWAPKIATLIAQMPHAAVLHAVEDLSS